MCCGEIPSFLGANPCYDCDCCIDSCWPRSEKAPVYSWGVINFYSNLLLFWGGTSLINQTWLIWGRPKAMENRRGNTSNLITNGGSSISMLITKRSIKKRNWFNPVAMSCAHVQYDHFNRTVQTSSRKWPNKNQELQLGDWLTCPDLTCYPLVMTNIAML